MEKKKIEVERLRSTWQILFTLLVVHLVSPGPTALAGDAAYRWIAVAGGQAHTVALKANGTLWSWGYNGHGNLGNGTTLDSPVPVQIGSDNDWAGVAAGGGQHSLALKRDGSLWAWGSNSYGQLGDGTAIERLVPVRIGTEGGWSGVAIGLLHTVEVKADGSLWAWGYNGSGQLGDGSVANSYVPVRVGTDTTWIAAAAGALHAIALKVDGTLWAWGLNGIGQLGDGTSTDRYSPVQIGTEADWVSAAAGYGFSVARKVDGSLWGWGDNGFGELGDGTSANYTYSPVRTGTDSDWEAVVAGREHTVALKRNGSIWAWGRNDLGELGDGTGMERHTPERIGTDTDWVSVSAGANHTLALKTDGTLWAWGYNGAGQLGDGTTTDRHSAVRVNHPPVAIDDAASTPKNSPIFVNLIANDSDMDGIISSTVLIVTLPTQGGTVEVVADGVLFTPARNFRGTDTFSYQAVDDLGALSNVSIVLVDVTK